jgi:hypothetical protein
MAKPSRWTIAANTPNVRRTKVAIAPAISKTEEQNLKL